MSAQKLKIWKLNELKCFTHFILYVANFVFKLKNFLVCRRKSSNSVFINTEFSIHRFYNTYALATMCFVELSIRPVQSTCILHSARHCIIPVAIIFYKSDKGNSDNLHWSTARITMGWVCNALNAIEENDMR